MSDQVLIKKIKHFEVVGDMEKFRNAWSNYLLGRFEKGLSRSDFLKKYLYPILGREIKKEETKGILFARIYYDEEDNITWMTLYDSEGWKGGLNLALRPPSKRKGRKSLKPEPIKVTYLEERFDAKTILTQSHGDIVKLQWGRNCQTYKKIPPSPYDIYFHDPELSIYHEDKMFGPEGSFYSCGYKMIDERFIDIDGIVNYGKRMCFNELGLITTIEYYRQLPYGDFCSFMKDEWIYDLKNHLVILRKISAKDQTAHTVIRYELDRNNRIYQRRDYLRITKHDKVQPEDIYTPQGMVLTTRRDYHYDKAGRLIEIKIEFKTNPDNSGRKTFEYKEGRLFRVRKYDHNDDLNIECTFEYLNENQRKVTYWQDLSKLIPQDE